MMKNDNKKKQVVIIVLSFLAVCLVAGLFLRTNTAKGTQDMPVQGGERNHDTGKQGDGKEELSSTPIPSGEIADGLGNNGKDEENSSIPTLSEGISPQPSDDKKGAGNPTPTQGEENNQPGSDAGDTPETGDKILDSGEKDETTEPKASATPKPEKVTTTPQITKKPAATTLPEKNNDQPEDRGDMGKEKSEETKKEDSGNKLNSPSEATPPPTPPADDKDIAPVENPDKDGNCRPEHKNPEKEETKKGESESFEGNKPPKKEEKPSKDEPSKKDDSKGEPPSEGAIYVPGFGWIEYEGPNSYEIAPNAGTGDIIGDM